MRNALLFICVYVCVAYCTILTANVGGACLPSNKVDGGYTECHAINVKYNLEKGRIITDGAEADSDIVFMIRLWDADSMRLDFIASGLHVNMAYADDEYKVPIDLVKDTKYIEIHYYNAPDDFSPYKEEYKCYNDDYIPWIISDTPVSQIKAVNCLPMDTTLSICKQINRYVYDDEPRPINCYTKLVNKPWIDDEYGIKVIYPTDSYARLVDDNVVDSWVKCPKGYVQAPDKYLCTTPSELRRIDVAPNPTDNVSVDYIPDCEPTNMIGGRCKEW